MLKTNMMSVLLYHQDSEKPGENKSYTACVSNTSENDAGL